MKVSELFEFMKQPKKTKETRAMASERKKQAQIQKWREGPVYKALTAPKN